MFSLLQTEYVKPVDPFEEAKRKGVEIMRAAVCQ
jgi:hypothetical protein